MAAPWPTSPRQLQFQQLSPTSVPSSSAALPNSQSRTSTLDTGISTSTSTSASIPSLASTRANARQSIPESISPDSPSSAYPPLTATTATGGTIRPISAGTMASSNADYPPREEDDNPGRTSQATMRTFVAEPQQQQQTTTTFPPPTYTAQPGYLASPVSAARTSASGGGGGGFLAWAQRRRSTATGAAGDEESEMDPDGVSMWSRGMLSSRPSTTTTGTTSKDKRSAAGLSSVASPLSPGVIAEEGQVGEGDARRRGGSLWPSNAPGGERQNSLPTIAGSERSSSAAGDGTSIRSRPSGPRSSISSRSSSFQHLDPEPTIRGGEADDYTWRSVLYPNRPALDITTGGAGGQQESNATWKLSKLAEESSATAAAAPGGLGRGGAGGAFPGIPAGTGGYDYAQPGGAYTYLAARTADDGDEEFSNIGVGPPRNQNKVKRSRMPRFLRKLHIRLRGIVLILLFAFILWIPGLVGLFVSHSLNRPKVASVGLGWWSMWFSVVWLSAFATRTLTIAAPKIMRKTIGMISITSRHYIAYLAAIEFYIALFVWSLVIWITWLALVWAHFQNPTAAHLSPLANGNTTNATIVMTNATPDDASQATSMVAVSRFLLGVSICTLLLLLEKFGIQVVAYNFHQVSYASRIAQCRFHLDILVKLYSHSRRDLQQPDTDLDAEIPVLGSLKTGIHSSPFNTIGAIGGSLQSAFRAGHGRGVYGINKASEIETEHRRQQSTTHNNALAAAASDMTMQGLVLPGSAERVVVLALTDPEQTKHLARRLFFSFARRDKEAKLVIRYVDFAAVLGEDSFAQDAWGVFDPDENGDILEEEMMQACQSIRKERYSVINSVRDVGSAVGALDGMFMSFYFVVSATIIAALLSVKFSSLVTSLGTVVLGLSWLISGSAQELLQAIVFLFVKHPYDVGDLVHLVDLEQDFLVEEMRMLSTIFRTMSGQFYQIGNAKLATGNGVINLRRSGPVEEAYKFEVAYSTTYQQLETLRAKMLLWLATQARDFLPGLDIQILDMTAPKSMTLSVGIRYKTNVQEYHLKQQRRNRWLCHFKELLAELQVEGPAEDSTKHKLSWGSQKGDAAREAVRGGVDREYVLMDQRENYELSLPHQRRQGSHRNYDEGQGEKVSGSNFYSEPKYTPAPTLARSEPSMFRRGMEDIEARNFS